MDDALPLRIWWWSLPIALLLATFQLVIPLPFSILIPLPITSHDITRTLLFPFLCIDLLICMMGTMIVVYWSHIAAHVVCAVRAYAGNYVATLARTRPQTPLRLYDLENDPRCRIVREACAQLCVTIHIRPCPVATRTCYVTPWREEMQNKYGHQQLPLLEDGNMSVVMTGDHDAIVDYLYKTYGEGKPFPPLGAKKPSLILSKIASFLRRAQPYGLYAIPANLPHIELELYGMENDTQTRPVRELLTSLQIPYISYPCGQGSIHRTRLVMELGELILPVLIDSNRERNQVIVGMEHVIQHIQRYYGKREHEKGE